MIYSIGSTREIPSDIDVFLFYSRCNIIQTLKVSPTKGGTKLTDAESA